jgi:hypothetical protein
VTARRSFDPRRTARARIVIVVRGVVVGLAGALAGGEGAGGSGGTAPLPDRVIVVGDETALLVSVMV